MSLINNLKIMLLIIVCVLPHDGHPQLLDHKVLDNVGEPGPPVKNDS